MDAKFSRRRLLQAATPLMARAAAADPFAQAPAAAPEPPSAADLLRIESGDLVATLDRRDGSIFAIEHSRDALKTNFVGNASNTRGIRLKDPYWTGHVLSTVFAANGGRGGRWLRQTTIDSADIRQVTVDGGAVSVRYEGASRNANGIQSYALGLTYSAGADGALLMRVEIQNPGSSALEIGELALPLRANDDYVEAYKGTSLGAATRSGRLSSIQQEIYEQKVLAHHFAGGYSSYALLERPRGTAPYLLFQALDAPIECVYKVEGFRIWHDDWVGTDLLGLHTLAVKQQRGWNDNPWVNGHTSLLLAPGESKTWHFQFLFIDDHREIARHLYEAGDLAIRVLPAMVVQENTDVQVSVQSKTPLEKVEVHSDQTQVKANRREGDRTLLTLAFRGRGQKTVKLFYGGGKWTNVHFYCVQPYEQLLKARGQFVIEREFYENPEDPFQRNHLFLPFDTRKGLRLEYTDNSSGEVGGAGDAGFSAPLFLSEKNVYFPSAREIDVLETYVADSLFNKIQNPQTYEIRSSLYWQEPSLPSMRGRSTKQQSEDTGRAYNYIFAGNVYHAMYRIGKLYGLLKKKTPQQYLEMAQRTYVKGYEKRPYNFMGLISGSNALHLLADLKEEGWQKQYDELLEKMRLCNAEFTKDPYPYGSEIAIDHTGQEQVYFFSRYFGNHEKRRKTVDTIRALKGAMQPVWFRYGNDLFAHPDLRNEICCWHSSAMNAMVLMQEFEDTGDLDLLMRAYPGHACVMTEITGEGAGYGWFMCTPGIYAHEPPRTFENGPAIWAFLRGAKAWVVNDQAFGLTGLGCSVHSAAGEVVAMPNDGVRKRLRFVAEKIDLNAATGEFEQVTLRGGGSGLQLQMGDSTGLVKTAQVTIRGLQQGNYEVRHSGKSEHMPVTDVMTLRLPMAAAAQIAVRRV
ncbi:MAG TPA: DUF5695 domain-containing protein [Candidatus Limnocylindrales bacterium]|nr:DUF5695 domain-containing protein [Candidatus Limnocylindrales bacterium]